MIYPEFPDHHRGDWQAEKWANRADTFTWKPRGAYRYCGYCGSLHPEDLVAVLKAGATLGGSDWKYGYPHKFYINNCPDRNAIKFYSKHLLDSGYDDEALDGLLQLLTAHTGITWTRDSDGEVAYRAPYHGYQR